MVAQVVVPVVEKTKQGKMVDKTFGVFADRTCLIEGKTVLVVVFVVLATFDEWAPMFVLLVHVLENTVSRV